MGSRGRRRRQGGEEEPGKVSGDDTKRQLQTHLAERPTAACISITEPAAACERGWRVSGPPRKCKPIWDEALVQPTRRGTGGFQSAECQATRNESLSRNAALRTKMWAGPRARGRRRYPPLLLGSLCQCIGLKVWIILLLNPANCQLSAHPLSLLALPSLISFFRHRMTRHSAAGFAALLVVLLQVGGGAADGPGALGEVLTCAGSSPGTGCWGCWAASNPSWLQQAPGAGQGPAIAAPHTASRAAAAAAATARRRISAQRPRRSNRRQPAAPAAPACPAGGAGGGNTYRGQPGAVDLHRRLELGPQVRCCCRGCHRCRCCHRHLRRR